MDNKQTCDEIQSDFNKQICEVIMHLYYTEVRLIILWFFEIKRCLSNLFTKSLQCVLNRQSSNVETNINDTGSEKQ